VQIRYFECWKGFLERESLISTIAIWGCIQQSALLWYHSVTPVFPKKTGCISYVCQDHNFTHMIDSCVISRNNAQIVQKRFINFYYTHEGRHEGLYTNNDNYEDTTSYLSSTGIRLVDRILRIPRSRWSTPLRDSPLNSVSKDEYTYGWYSARPQE
jgi:hypothetical protein